MADKLQLYNEALFHCQARRLADLIEDVEPRHHLDLHYDSAMKYMIEQGYWKFAMRTVSITYDPDIAPAFGISKAFNKPEDLVKLYQMSASEYLDPPLLHWIEESNLFWAEEETIYVRYVSNSDDGYGYDLDRWTGKYQLAFTLELAHRVAPRLPGSSVDMKALFEMKEAVRNEALSFEAMKEPPKRPPEGNWNRSRFGRGNYRENRG
jgi:hypothetical protein